MVILVMMNSLVNSYDTACQGGGVVVVVVGNGDGGGGGGNSSDNEFPCQWL